MSPIKVDRIAHIVLFVRDPEASAQWYCDVLNMKITARAGDGPYKGGVFMSFGESDHDIALFKAEDGATKGKEFEHVGLMMAGTSMEDLRANYAFFKDRGVEIAEILDHGVSVGIYFYDPDGHMLEVFCQKVPQTGGLSQEELNRNQGQANPTTL
ncbi:catechol 2,3-dioxygenase-like lactoylglutathione lyase family enzyme [Novosphingobium hassiacum]|uniref:Catechol 2,3-dioxygenase-like lactoylglutathione lyase family enzyme n=1 Tax=Novosphingobium hassiacum TaxID=173676 RepID=A0A7W5ZSY4_9SPHN|nr:VOC family protein [Novosphingobium hassiacum]MBB3859386.1 catechol 2,3-dioxygenase-like lactoylglutathione lyase family enzyme [Novosphingobium hassiacum]